MRGKNTRINERKEYQNKWEERKRRRIIEKDESRGIEWDVSLGLESGDPRQRQIKMSNTQSQRRRTKWGIR